MLIPPLRSSVFSVASEAMWGGVQLTFSELMIRPIPLLGELTSDKVSGHLAGERVFGTRDSYGCYTC